MKCIDSGYLVGTTPLTVFFWLFWNFADVFCMEWRCACGFCTTLWLFLFVFFSIFCLTFCLVSFFDMRCYQSVWTAGILWAQLLLQFSTDCFETLQMLSAWNEDVHVVWVRYYFDYFFSFFLLCELSLFFWHEMLSKYIDSRYLMGATPLTVFLQLFWNFADVFWMEWRCACGFSIILWYFFSLSLQFTSTNLSFSSDSAVAGLQSDSLTALVFNNCFVYAYLSAFKWMRYCKLFCVFYSLLLAYIFICIWKCKILWQKLLLFMKSVVKKLWQRSLVK